MLCLPLDYLNGWLFGINANRVKPEVKDALLRYQRDVYCVLADAFLRGEVTHRPSVGDLDEWLASADNPLAMAYRTGMAIANMARQQAEFERKIENRFESAESRLDLIEAELGKSDRFVTEVQASELAELVKTVAAELGQRTGGSEYGAVYAELYRRYSVTSYKRLPAAKFDDAMNWLRMWLEDLNED